MLDDETQETEKIEESDETVASTAEAVEDEVAGEGEEQPTAPRRERRQRVGGGERSGETALEAPTEPPPPPRLYEQFKVNIVPTMMNEFSYGNTMEVPRLQKIVLNIGVGEALLHSALHT